MNNALKRIPKWAWFLAAGVGVGGIALRFASARKDAQDAEAATTGTDPATGAPVGTLPPATVIPPVVIGGGGESGATSDTNALTSTLISGFQSVLDTAGSLAWHPDQVITLLANGGGPPGMAQDQPPPVNVNVQFTPPPSAPAPAVPAPKCTGEFNQGTPPNCFKDCYHDTCEGHQKKRHRGHCYRDGKRVATTTDVMGRC